MRAARPPADGLWPVLARLGGLPMRVIRGGQSDILSAESLERMRRGKPDLEALTVPDRGHVPLRDEPEGGAEAIERFLARLVPSVPARRPP